MLTVEQLTPGRAGATGPADGVDRSGAHRSPTLPAPTVVVGAGPVAGTIRWDPPWPTAYRRVALHESAAANAD